MRASSRNSTRSTRSGRLARPTSRASGTPDGSPLPDMYDDGGLSGGTMERPALQRLLTDIKAGKVQIVVVYKVDRLTRSLADFAKIVDVLDAHDASLCP